MREIKREREYKGHVRVNTKDIRGICSLQCVRGVLLDIVK